MKITVAILSKSKNDPLITLGLDYLNRLRPPFSANAIFLFKKNFLGEEQKQLRMKSEGNLLLEKSEGYRIALDDKGKQFSSDQFALLLQKLAHQTSKTTFLIGGAFGLSEEVLKKSDQVISLSSMTMPHRLAFLLLSEQLYRAAEILNNSPYHK